MRVIFLLLLILPTGSSLFSQKIKGTVTDDQGKPLGFASVFIKENNRGTHANADGKYSLKVDNGTYTLVCQYVGYKKEERKITIDNNDVELNFILSVQDMTLGEVIVRNGEDPAYAIIRNAIKKRPYYQQQIDRFQCQVYTKGQLRLRDYPDKVLGQKVDFEDGDTSRKKIVFLSETISNYYVDRPNKIRTEVISSKVSGQANAFGLATPGYLSFYKNNIYVGENLNPRGFISPIAENALNYYKYKLEGTYFVDGLEVSHIRVIPKRKFEPLFNGHIDIVADQWRIYSVQLLLTRSSQMERLDTLRIEQTYRPANADIWYVSSQVIYPTVKIMGFDMFGSFVNVYSDFNPDPVFTKKTFSSTLLKYTDSSNKKSETYWESNRPLALQDDEARDYVIKDSLALRRKDPHYIDSIERIRNKITPLNVLLLGQTFSSERKRTIITIPSLLEQVSFNPAEGWLLNASITWSKRLDTTFGSRRRVFVTPTLRYGFSNMHFNPHLTVGYNFGKKYFSSIMLSGGKRVFQFNNDSPIGLRGNTISCLFSEENRYKSYEASYLRGSIRKGIGGGLTLVAGAQYQDRRPLDNRTDYTWRDKKNRSYTPNYPNEIMNSNIRPHQVFEVLAGFTWQPGARYLEIPGQKMNIGSKWPVFSAEYIKAFKGVGGSDADFSKWNVGITDGINLKLFGKFRYRFGIGGFIDTGSAIQVPDYNHFNGNISTLATEYLNSFQLLPIYQFSNTSRFYVLGHIEHNFKGLLTNKIPVINRLNLYLVGAANGFYINKDRYYYELSIGFDNIFKQVRVDFVQSFLNGKAWQNGIRVGFSRLSRKGDDWP